MMESTSKTTSGGTMHDLGRHPKTMMASPVYSSEAERKPTYPLLMLNSTELPAVKDWKVGGTYTLTIQVRMRSHTKDGGNFRGDFDVLKAKVEPLGYAKG